MNCEIKWVLRKSCGQNNGANMAGSRMDIGVQAFRRVLESGIMFA